MNEFAKRIEKNIRSKKASGKEVFEDILFGLIKKTSMDIDTIINAPTPLVIAMSDKVSKYYIEKTKAMDKKR